MKTIVELEMVAFRVESYFESYDSDCLINLSIMCMHLRYYFSLLYNCFLY